VLKVQTGPRIRRTHKGEEIVGDEGVTISPQVDGSASAPFAKREDIASGKEDEAPASPRSPASNQSQTYSPPPEPERPQVERKQSNFDIQNVWSHLRSPTSQNEPSEIMDLDILPDDIIQMKTIDDPDIDRIINEDVTNSPPYSPSAHMYDLPSTSESVPPIWNGEMTMPSVAQFSAQARFIGGPHSVTDLLWSTILPSNLAIEGRIPIATTTKYLDAQRSSSSKHVIAIQIEASEDSQKEPFENLYQYFHERQRYGVLQISSNVVKDAYLIPLSPNDPIPPQITSMDSHDIPLIRTEPLLLVLLIILKEGPFTLSPGQSILPIKSPQESKPFSPSVVQPPQTDPTSSVESLGLSPADLAALQGILIAHPDILTNPQILTNPAILQNLIQQHLSGQPW
jgi:SPOC domain